MSPYQFDLALAALLDGERVRLFKSSLRLAKLQKGLMWSLGLVVLSRSQDDLDAIGDAQSNSMWEWRSRSEPFQLLVSVCGVDQGSGIAYFSLIAVAPAPALLSATCSVASSKPQAESAAANPALSESSGRTNAFKNFMSAVIAIMFRMPQAALRYEALEATLSCSLAKLAAFGNTSTFATTQVPGIGQGQ